jgi:hypothetical protein
VIPLSRGQLQRRAMFVRVPDPGISGPVVDWVLALLSKGKCRDDILPFTVIIRISKPRRAVRLQSLILSRQATFSANVSDQALDSLMACRGDYAARWSSIFCMVMTKFDAIYDESKLSVRYK